MIDPLPPVDHDDIDYEKFTKNFYEEHQEIGMLMEGQVNELRTKLGIRVRSRRLLYWFFFVLCVYFFI